MSSAVEVPSTLSAGRSHGDVGGGGVGRWLTLLAGVLLAVFAGVAWLQSQSLALLNATVQYQGDNLVWSFYQVEAEFEKLRSQTRELSFDPSPDKVESLQTRYELFVSRLSLIAPERTDAVLVRLPLQEQVLRDVNAFVAHADGVIGLDSKPPMDAAFWRDLESRLLPLAGAIHELSLQANRGIAEQVAARNDAVRQQNRIAIGLTVFQSLLTLLFAVIVVRQLSALQQRRAHLEALAISLQEARLEAEQASRAKSAFLANMSHELRTPFNGLLGMLSLLQRSRLDATQADYLLTARESGEHLLGILNDVLDISKLESGKLEITTAPTLLHRVLGDVRSVMSPQAQAKGLHWHVTLAEDVPVCIDTDAKRLKQILFNLVGNALKFTERGEVSLVVDRLSADLRQGRSEPLLRLRVSDTGIGMDGPTMTRLFQRFSQGDETINRRYGGTGLGLEISRSLARMMGGDIQVESRPGQGSAFTLVLPLRLADEAIDRSDVVPDSGWRESMAAALEASEPQVLQPLDVLVTDDHPVNRKFIHALLVQLGHQVSFAEDGQQALDMVSRHRYDLVLMDVHMPVMDGIAATRAIRALGGEAARTRIVALTADAFTESRQRVFDAGMDDFLAKPVQVEEIEQLFKRHFGARGRIEAPAAEAPAPAATPAPEPTPASAETTTLAPIPVPPPPAATPPAAPRRRFRRGDAARVLDLEAIGEVCVAVSIKGYGDLLGGFLSDESGTLADLLMVLRQADASRLKAAGHKLKGAAANLGLRELAATAKTIEQGGETLDAAQCEALAARLVEEFETARALCARMGWIAG
ncbi:ATP-binding protein [Sphaerotilus mobilis]|uniref:ATP-binding protein n=1 Tax=Sphaerotilus mobilis TaxID=47994 RepID=UPI00102BAB26|nr:ATP-binding protein [Sphaerotilus mobilis]